MTKKEYIEKYGEEAYQRRLEYVRKYREQHRDEIKQYREQHREERKQWYEANREERKQYWKQYNQQHREEHKQYREEHRDEIKQYREQHREERKQWSRNNRHMFIYCIPEQIEQIENYQFAKKVNFDGWDIHHRLETHNSDGEKRLVNLSKAELIALDMYYNRPANELIFLTKSEHTSLHNRNRISKANSLGGQHCGI